MTQLTNLSNVPLAMAVFLASDSYDYDPAPKTISVTTLMKPVRQIIMQARAAMMPNTVPPDIMDRAANRLGSSLHDAIERVWKDRASMTGSLLRLGYPASLIQRIQINPTDEYLENNPNTIPVYMEQRERKQVGSWTVTGKFDFVAEAQVQDFKSANVLSYQKQRNAEKQAMQGSLYRWLNPKKITKDKMIIMHFFVDWSKAMAKAGANNNYPPNRVMRQELDLKSVNEVDVYVLNKLALIDKYWDADEEDIPECNEEDLWRNLPVFKYYKKGKANQARSTKNFEDRTEAYVFFSEQGGVGELHEVPGLVKA